MLSSVLRRSFCAVTGVKNMSSTNITDMNFSTNRDRMVWVDLEMTGLDVETDHIIEIACLVTDGDLNIVAEGPNLVIHQPESVLNAMNDWCKEHHGKAYTCTVKIHWKRVPQGPVPNVIFTLRPLYIFGVFWCLFKSDHYMVLGEMAVEKSEDIASGLTEAVRKSQISLSSAESQVLGFLTTLTPPGVCPLAGNSVHADRMFLSKYMPRLTNHLHYRIIDVSSIKELCRRWCPKQFEEVPRKKLCHRALDDIKESVEELKYYRKSIFIS